jgi:hypothetical protein
MRSDSDSEREMREQAATALVNKGVALYWLDRSEEAITTFEEVIRRFGGETESGISALVERARKALNGGVWT